MAEDDAEPKDWEIKDETPPDKLQKKWSKEQPLRETNQCPECKKYVPESSLTCLFCGAQVYQDSGLLGKLLKWTKQIFKK